VWERAGEMGHVKRRDRELRSCAGNSGWSDGRPRSSSSPTAHWPVVAEMTRHGGADGSLLKSARGRGNSEAESSSPTIGGPKFELLAKREGRSNWQPGTNDVQKRPRPETAHL